MKRLNFVFVLVWILMMAGCNGALQSRFAGLDQNQARALARRLAMQREQELADDLKSAFAVRQPRNILVLSGGGADGAFGCGVLDGWQSAPSGRPTFDVVTGVSTGALMATFAFLGEAQDGLTLLEVYTKTRDPDVHDGPFTVGVPDSIFDTGPLERLIARHVTADTIARVAAAHRSGRRLYVATVDLDAGELVIWPLSKIAAGQGPACLARFRKILLAAASVPVVFPPVRIDGDLQVDAGLREAVFLRQAMLGMSKAYQATRALDAAAAPPTVWAIVNSRLGIDPKPIDDNLIDIGGRSLTIYTQSLQFFNLREIAHLAAANHPAFAFRYASVPPELDSDEAQQNLSGPMFDPGQMSRLYAAGEQMALDRSAWHEGSPRVDNDPTLAAMTSISRAGR